MSITTLARAEIQALKPYEAAIQVDDTIRLNANEAPWKSSGDHFRRPLNRYPEIRPAVLRAMLSSRYGCKPENLMVTRGTSEAIDLLIRVFCRAGKDNLVTTRPTFSMYEHYAVVQGAELRQVTTSGDADFEIAADEILGACDDSTKLIFLCSPNNPTGTLLPRSVLIEILERRATRSAVVVDEAYIEFAGEESAVKLNAVQAPYALATPVVECVENALQAESSDEAEDWITRTISERERLGIALRELPFVRHAWPSAANFILVEVADARALMQHSADDKVLLRYFGGDLADCVRITIGTPAENDRLLESMASMGVSHV